MGLSVIMSVWCGLWTAWVVAVWFLRNNNNNNKKCNRSYHRQGNTTLWLPALQSFFWFVKKGIYILLLLLLWWELYGIVVYAASQIQSGIDEWSQSIPSLPFALLAFCLCIHSHQLSFLSYFGPLPTTCTHSCLIFLS